MAEDSGNPSSRRPVPPRGNIATFSIDVDEDAYPSEPSAANIPLGFSRQPVATIPEAPHSADSEDIQPLQKVRERLRGRQRSRAEGLHLPPGILTWQESDPLAPREEADDLVSEGKDGDTATLSPRSAMQEDAKTRRSRFTARRASMDKPQVSTNERRRETPLRKSEDARVIAERAELATLRMLCSQWLEIPKSSTESLEELAKAKKLHVYLVENLFPNVVECVSKLLLRAEREGFLRGEKPPPPGFCPINALARSLMRGSRVTPKSALSRYERSMVQTRQKLKGMMEEQSENLLAAARAVAQRKEAERKSRAQARLNLRRAIEAEMEEVLVGSWTDVDGICFVTRSHIYRCMWNVADEQQRGCDYLSESESESESVTDLERVADFGVESEPFNTKLASKVLLSATKNEVLLMEKQAIDIAMPVLERCNASDRRKIYSQMQDCGDQVRAIRHPSTKRVQMDKAFDELDAEKSGLLSRQKVLKILTDFYDSADVEVRRQLNFPRSFPVVDILEIQEEHTFLPSLPDSGPVTGTAPESDQLPSSESPDDVKLDEEKTGNDQSDDLQADPFDQDVHAPIPAFRPSSGLLLLRKCTKMDEAIRFGMIPTLSEYRDHLREVGHSATTRTPPLLSARQASPGNEMFLKREQCFTLLENFLGGTWESGDELPKLLEKLATDYRDLPVEVSGRKRMSQCEEFYVNHLDDIDKLFDKWDHDGSGYIEYNELVAVLENWNNGKAEKTVKQARIFMKEADKDNDSRLSRDEFHHLVQFISSDYIGMEDDEDFFELVQALDTNIELTNDQKDKRRCHRKWLREVLVVGAKCRTDPTGAFKAAFNVLKKNNRKFSTEKKTISPAVALVQTQPSGEKLLEFAAACKSDKFLVGMAIQRTKRKNNITYAALYSQETAHVPNIRNEHKLQVLNKKRGFYENGQFIAVPILHKSTGASLGLLTADTMQDSPAIHEIEPWEIQFFERVANALSHVLYVIECRKRLTTVLFEGMRWAKRALPEVNNCSLFAIEFLMDAKKDEVVDYALREVVHFLGITPVPGEVYLRRAEAPSREFYFRSIDTSMPVTRMDSGSTHIAIPIRDSDGKYTALLDIELATPFHNLHQTDQLRLTNLLRQIIAAQCEITDTALSSAASSGVDDVAYLQSDVEASNILMKVMLEDVRTALASLSESYIAELRRYIQPPKAVRSIMCAALSLLSFGAGCGRIFEKWEECLPAMVRRGLKRDMEKFDPSSVLMTQEQHNQLDDKILSVAAKPAQLSVPIQYIYDWTLICLLVIQCQIKLREEEQEQECKQVQPEDEPEHSKRKDLDEIDEAQEEHSNEEQLDEQVAPNEETSVEQTAPETNDDEHLMEALVP